MRLLRPVTENRKVEVTHLTHFDTTITVGKVYDVLDIDFVGNCYVIDDTGEEIFLFKGQYKLVEN